ncbi:inositol polyphosphate-4-phosphatase type I A isoform X2 [Octopus sinensis]|uniref:phosphatidylinositol-3,4-bisphosphate 4-phosphatase n=1 Tax=Octopus sinensis TaxID=2607531 RepID=A0A6P7TE72_9MOLL|nr:inositol polyphosphate-4-phosphatase type I A isoform X2 [Octopus sinensis]
MCWRVAVDQSESTLQRSSGYSFQRCRECSIEVGRQCLHFSSPHVALLHPSQPDSLALTKTIMRFNSKALASLSLQTNTKFDKEGIVWMKDKQDGLFKKGEAFVERFCRLKGNMLFYFKSKEFTNTDPLGVLIIERCTVELDTDDDNLHGFMLVYEGDENPVHFATRTEEQRDQWIQTLHIASYECLKMQLQSLREQLVSKTGHDPLDRMPQQDTCSTNPPDLSGEEPCVEICIAAKDLPNDRTGQPPNPFVMITTITPPQQTWTLNSHTEIIERSNDPQFLKTIGFGTNIKLKTRVKFTVYHVNERMTNTMSQLGYVMFDLKSLLAKPDKKLHLPLMSPDSSPAGQIQITAWVHDESILIEDNSRGSVSYGEKLQNRGLGNLKIMFFNPIKKTFRFDTNKARMQLFVQEVMAEFKWNYTLPLQLLKLFIEEERERINMLQDLGELVETFNRCRQECLDFHMSSVTMYTQSCRSLSTATPQESLFKASSIKADKEYEFVPINLHLQRMQLIDENTNTTCCYDCITHGSLAAFSQKFKSGGLLRILEDLRETRAPEGCHGKQSKLDRACHLLNCLASLKHAVHFRCSRLCRVAMQGTAAELKEAMEQLNLQVKELVKLCDNPIFNEASAQHMRARTEASNAAMALQMSSQNQLSATATSSNLLQAEPTAASNSDDAKGTDSNNWRWTGSNFVRSPTMEPWDMSCVNTEAATMCLMSLVDDLIQNKNNPMDIPKWLSEISPRVIELQKFIEILFKRANLSLTFLLLLENREHVPLLQTIKYRRDISFSHAVTVATAGFISKIYENLENAQFLEQLYKVGVLLHFEGLVSCHAEEMGIIEDMSVAVEDLASIKFKLTRKDEIQELQPSLQLTDFVKEGRYPDMNRHSVVVCIPLLSHMFDKLPSKLQSGHHINVSTSYFNVGINELATLAEKFGSTALQDDINKMGFKKMNDYFEAYSKACGDPDSDLSGTVAGRTTELIRQLQYNVLSKKSKNVDILHISSEITRKLNGVRFICCKSGKDRTSMSATLEQVQLLQREHNLAPHVFMQALDCFRSEGTRRENTLKNVGVRKYNFNSLQMLSIPRLYRAPRGTYGNT